MSGHSGGLGDRPVEPEFATTMAALADGLDQILNGKGVHGADRKVGFILQVFNMNEIGMGRVNYISNCERRDVLVMLKEQVARFEGLRQKPGRA